MTDALDQTARGALERFIQRARGLLEDDLARHAEGRFGIHATDGTIEDEESLHLSPDDLAVRRDIVDVLHFIRREEPDHPAAVSRLVREVAFTHLNRLVAIRIAEAIGLLPESIANGPASAGYRELLEVAPLLAHDASGGYWRYLQLCGDELAADLPQLFDPRNPLLELAPSPAAFDELIDLLTAAELVQVWDAPDAFGWAYQFFNGGDERRAMRDASPSPRNPRELAVRNQFFTPRYVVDFLVHNSLGRRLLDADPTSPLIDDLPLLLDAPTEPGEPLDLAEVRVLDPACGSGHFLLGAYDVLERAWRHAGVEPDDAAPRIVASLWGIDIDPRCAQVAAAAIILRARRACPRNDLPAPNIICARALPEPTEGWETLLAGLPDDRRQLVAAMRDALDQAPVLGPLLKVEERLATEIRARVVGADDTAGTLFTAAGVANDAFGHAEADVLSVLRQVADQTTSTPAERLFAAEASDAIRFVEALHYRFDTVIMNPPFGLGVPECEPYLRAHYGEVWTDLYGAFIWRAKNLLRPRGALGAITSSQWFITRKMKGLREALITGARPHAIVNLGAGVLHQATVNTAMFTLPQSRSTGLTWYADLSQVPVVDKGARISSLTHTVNGANSETNLVDLGTFATLEGSPLALHVGASVLSLWSSGLRLEPATALVRSGCNTFDDFRFIRCWWELDHLYASRGWRPFEKGGEYQPYLAPYHLVVDWRDDGRELREWGETRGVLAQVMQSSSHWGAPGLCYPRQSSVGFGARLLPAGEIFSGESIGIFPSEPADVFNLLGVVNSTVAAELLDVFGKGRKTENRAMKNLPISPEMVVSSGAIGECAGELSAWFERIEALDEASVLFEGPPHDFEEMRAWWSRAEERISGVQTRVDQLAAELLGVKRRLDPTVADRSTLVLRALPPSRVDERSHVLRCISFLVGVAFGRWRADAQWRPQLSEGLDPSKPLHSLPPAFQTVGDGEGRERILLDEPGSNSDLILALERLETRGVGVGSLGEFERILGRGLRDAVRRDFFAFHLKGYTKSRRKAPIYWPLYVPSGKWGVWVYAPRLTRETLYVVASEALRREGHAEVEIERLERERAAGGGGRGAKALDKALDDERKLAEELRRFRQEAERIAGLGWEPDLDDGVVLCAAPLADLFPQWRKELVGYRDELRAGKYEWSTVSKWADQL